MTDLDLNLPAIDDGFSIDGKWIEYDEKISFLIARTNTPGYSLAMRKMHKKYARQIETANLTDVKAITLMADLMTEFILLDWKGLSNGGKKFVYDKDNCRALLVDKKYFELRDWVYVQASELENFRLEKEKKTGPPS